MARRTKCEIMAGVAHATGAKIVAPNTVRYTDASGATVWRLHRTDIITKTPLGVFVLNSGGWRTPTTKDRLNHFAPVRVHSDRGEWFIGDCAFFDGIEVDPVGTVLNARPDAGIAARKERAAIARFAARCDVGPLPQPNGGDCWCCSMFDRIETAGAVSRDPAHLWEHIREGYLHGSLIVNAMRWAGYSDGGIAYAFQSIGRDNAKRALRRFLTRQLELAAAPARKVA